MPSFEVIIMAFLAFSAVILARVATVYHLLGASKVDGEPIPRSWKNVALLGGMNGALSIALAASLPADTPSRDLITSMVLGVAFLSIIIQGFLISQYASRRFPPRRSGGIQTVLSAERIDVSSLSSKRMAKPARRICSAGSVQNLYRGSRELLKQ